MLYFLLAFVFLLLQDTVADAPFHRKDAIGKNSKVSNNNQSSKKKDRRSTTPEFLPTDDATAASSLLSTETTAQSHPLTIGSNHTTKTPSPNIPAKKTRIRKTKKPKTILPTTTEATFTSHTQKTRKLRLHREWKDAVAAGIAFDWKKNAPVRPAVPQTLWLGPMSNLNEWHFSFVGLGDPYKEGFYHGVLKLPLDYPASPPKIQVWTPCGRFQTHRNLCLDVSNYHPESWKPNLTIRSIVDSVRVHMMTPADHAIGSLGDSYRKRQLYAAASRRYRYERNASAIDHAHMIRNGWVLGMTVNDEEEYVAASMETSIKLEEAPLLESLLMRRPMRLLLVGAFCILFLLLNT